MRLRQSRRLEDSADRLEPPVLLRFGNIIKKAILIPIAAGILGCAVRATAADKLPLNISGIYPHLTMWNDGNECGTGAVVPWRGSLWAITYSPHKPGGSDDRLYEITPDLEQIIFPGSVGGTPANRMIHKESNQLLIGPYLIDSGKNVRDPE